MLQYYSAVRAARSCLLTMLTSSSSFALIGHRTLELYYFILLLLYYYYFIIIIIILLFYFILFYFILFYFIKFYFILFYFIKFYFILFYFILFYFILLNTSHSSPPPSSLSPPQPALFAEVRTLPIFQHFSSKSLSFNMADLGQKYSDSTDFSTFFFKIPIF